MAWKASDILKSFVSSVSFTGGTRLLSKYATRRRVWLITIVLACIACSIQLYFCVVEYREFVTNAVVENEEFEFKFPDITVCSTHPFSRSKTTPAGTGLLNAQKFWSVLMNASDSLDDQEDSFFRAGNSFQAFAKDRDIFDNVLDEVFHCSYKGRPCFRGSFREFSSVSRPNCVTFSPKERSILIVDKNAGLHLILSLANGFTVLDPFSKLHASRGFEVIIHEKDTLPQVNSDSILVENGTQATIKLQLKKYVRESSKRARCYDQAEAEERLQSHIHTIPRPLDKGGSSFTYNYTESDCYPIVITSSYMLKQNCRCIPEMFQVPFIWNTSVPYCHAIPRRFFFNEKIDSATGSLTFENKSYNIFDNEEVKLIRKKAHCVKRFIEFASHFTKMKRFLQARCPARCHKLTYEKSVTFTKWPLSKQATMETLNTYSATTNTAFNANATPIGNENEIDSMVSILIYPSDLSVAKTTESFAYPLSQLVSDFGGNIGLWIGCSLLTVAELMEFIVRVVALRVRGSNEAPELDRNMELENSMKDDELSEKKGDKEDVEEECELVEKA